MVDLHSILHDYNKRRSKDETQLDTKKSKAKNENSPTFCEIPELFFDKVLVKYKLNRVEIIVLMWLYRQVWCRPNLYRMYGISPLMSLSEVSQKLSLNVQEIYQSLKKLEGYEFIVTVRSGQYFVRRYFTREFDDLFAQTYDDFEF